MINLFAYLDSSRLGESFAASSFVFEEKMQILAKILVKKWGHALPPPVPTLMFLDHTALPSKPIGGKQQKSYSVEAQTNSA